MTAREPSSQERAALLLLAPLIAVIGYDALAGHWQAAVVCDTRTYLEMIRGIAEHGLPWLDNDGMPPFPEIQARWNVVHGGHLWGAYPPLYPYLAAPWFALGGLRALPIFNHTALVALVLGIYALARRVLLRPLAATGATYLTFLGTPIWAGAFDPSPYPLLVTLVVWHVYFVHRAAHGSGRAIAFVSGLFGGLAIATHLLAFPMVAAAAFALALRLDADVSRGVRALLPYHRTLARAGIVLLGLAGPLVMVGLLNRARFGSWNPLSYGPCTWRTCVADEVAGQSVGAMIRFAFPVLAWITGTAACAWFVRRSKPGTILVLAVSMFVVSPVQSGLHEHAVALAGTAWAWIADNTNSGAGFDRLGDGFGNFIGPHVTKSMLQGTPILALALFARTTRALGRGGLVVLALPIVALLTMLTLRGNINLRAALGSPYIHMRYLMPALPLLVILATAAIEALPLTRAHLAVAAVGGVGLALWLGATPNDLDYTRRLLLLRATLVVAALNTLLAVRSRITGRWRALGWTATVAASLGFGISLGVDFVGLRAMTAAMNERYDHLAARTPQRFALIGWGLDPELSVRATRDVAYADLHESASLDNAHTLALLWWAEGRPVYTIVPGATPASPWPDLRLVPIEPERGLYTLEPAR